MHFTIDLVSEFGEPLEPKEAASVFVYQCGAIVKDATPITTQKWNKPGKKIHRDGETFVDDRAKDGLWKSLMAHFSLPELDTLELTEAWRLQVRKWALKK